LPTLVLCAVVIPGLPSWHKFWPVLAGGGLLVFLDQISRDAGKRLEPQLWDSWGGPPTTRLLRHKDNPNPVLHARRHAKLARLTGEEMPTKEQEQRDPARADHVYEAAAAYLRACTRSEAYPLVLLENGNYGFRRNMLGLKPIGLILAAATGGVALLGCALSLGDITNFSPSALAGVSVLCGLSLALWKWKVTPEWVRRGADNYAERLLEAIETLEPQGQ